MQTVHRNCRIINAIQSAAGDIDRHFLIAVLISVAAGNNRQRRAVVRAAVSLFRRFSRKFRIGASSGNDHVILNRQHTRAAILYAIRPCQFSIAADGHVADLRMIDYISIFRHQLASIDGNVRVIRRSISRNGVIITSDLATGNSQICVMSNRQTSKIAGDFAAIDDNCRTICSRAVIAEHTIGVFNSSSRNYAALDCQLAGFFVLTLFLCQNSNAGSTTGRAVNNLALSVGAVINRHITINSDDPCIATCNRITIQIQSKLLCDIDITTAQIHIFQQGHRLAVLSGINGPSQGSILGSCASIRSSDFSNGHLLQLADLAISVLHIVTS